MTVALLAFLAGVLLGVGGTGANALLVPVLNLVSGLKVGKIITAGIVSSALLKPATAALYTARKKLNFAVAGYLLLGSLPAALLATWVFVKIAETKVSRHHWDYVFSLLLSICSAALLLSIYKGFALRSRRSGGDFPLPPGSGIRSFAAPRKREAASSAALFFLRRAILFRDSDNGKRNGAEGKYFAVSAAKKGAVFVLGVVSGFLFGLTSIGSGSLTVSFLSLIFPEMDTRELVAIDLLQAAPLSVFAAAGQILFAALDMRLFLVLTLMGFPGMICGWLLSRRLPNLLLKGVIAAVIWLVAADYAYKSGGSVMLVLPATVLGIFAVLLCRRQVSFRREKNSLLSFSAFENENLQRGL